MTLLLHAQPRSADVSIRSAKPYRRSEILATVRSLLLQHGPKGVAVRELAKCSGYSVQTIYNLCGDQAQALEGAITEYSDYLLSHYAADAESPDVLLQIVDGWIYLIQKTPDYCRWTSKMIFSESHRALFYANRRSYTLKITKLLQNHQRLGIMRADVDAPELAEQLVLFSSALVSEWSVQGISLDKLRNRLSSGFVSLLSDKYDSSTLAALERRRLS